MAVVIINAASRMRGLRARLSELEQRPAATREVAVIPEQVVETLAEIAARAEALAAKVEERTGT